MNSFQKIKYKVRYFLLKRKLLKHINSGKIIPTSERHRCIGKSTALIEISRQYDIPIITHSMWHVDFLKNKGIEAYSIQSMDRLRGKIFDNGVLIEEGCSDLQLRELRLLGIDIRTGFYYNPYFI